MTTSIQEQFKELSAAYNRFVESSAAGRQQDGGATPVTAGILVRSARSSPSTSSLAPPPPAGRSGGAAGVAVFLPANGEMLAIDDSYQVRSERVSPRGETLSPVGAAGSTARSGASDTNTMPVILPTNNNNNNFSGGRAASNSEVEVYKAAEQLCILISGVDYRTIALQATKACDLVSKMIFEEVSLAKRSDWVPSYLVARQADRLRDLFRETKTILAANNIAIPTALERITSPAPPTSPGMANRHRTVSVDASAAGGGRGVHKAADEQVSPHQQQQQHQRPLIPSADEAYDVRLMHSAFDDRSDPRTREMEDEIMVLKSRLDKANREKRELQSTVERQEQQLVSMRTKLTKDTEVFYQTQRQMQADLRQLAVTTGHRELLNSDDEVSPTEQRPSPGGPGASPYHNANNNSNNVNRSLVPTPPDATVPVFLHPDSSANDDDGGVRPTSSTSRPSRGRPTSAPDINLQPFAKYNRLDTLYHDVYKGKGMEFLQQAIDVVFKLEYDIQHQHSNSNSNLQTASTDGHPSTTTTSGTETTTATTATVASDSLREDTLRKEHQQFLNDFRTRVLQSVEEFSTFKNLFADATPLRSEYVAHCMEMRCKPNSGVVALLSTISTDSEVVELNLSGNYVGDAGLSPLLPVLQRLYRLRTLRLADNGLKNNAIRALCHAVRAHPSLTAIDLSKNNITRSAGRELLSLVASMPKLRVIDVASTLIDVPLVAKIQTRLELNQSSAQSASTLVTGSVGAGSLAPTSGDVPRSAMSDTH
ncbi:leucine-rich repeat protein, putative [Bodo saltans]|uniref:Leucine-rich repeat protein, putative n=1 Tax=Bodo saltans TaxID=75058 RepID=A0A0S4IPN4_BODSA|nr:leucine-rich repeat protein, putative [Bodo saltans]|eukprot:CUF00357.1 leucine-rich repeat protein, putative [Bodo saltans]